jgi:hypothetical protein
MVALWTAVERCDSLNACICGTPHMCSKSRHCNTFPSSCLCISCSRLDVCILMGGWISASEIGPHLCCLEQEISFLSFHRQVQRGSLLPSLVTKALEPGDGYTAPISHRQTRVHVCLQLPLKVTQKGVGSDTRRNIQ